MFRSFAHQMAILVLSILAACGGGNSPSDSPRNIDLTAGDGRVIVRWTQESDLEYWIFRARATTITRDDYSTFPEADIDAPVNSPHSVTGLTNGSTYSFVMNATKKQGPAGPTSSSHSATPDLAGDLWTALDGDANTNDVIFANGKFYAVGNGAKIFEGVETLGPTSDIDNKITWAKREAPANFIDDLRGIAANGDATKFVAVGVNGKVLTSSDGITWAEVTGSATASLNLNAIAFGNGIFVAVGENTKIFTSGDGSSWNSQTLEPSGNLKNVAFLAGQFVAVGASGLIATSPDGTTWTRRDSPPSTPNLHGVAFGGSKYIIVGDAGTVLESTDAETWSVPGGLPPTATQNLNDVYFGSRFVAVGAGSTIVTSTTDSAGTLSWQKVTNGNTGDLFATAYGLGANVAVGSAETYSYSWQ